MAGELTPRIEARGVSRAFGATRALEGVQLSALPGEVHAVLGENGAGKSTLMHVLAGVLTPDAGTLLLDGAPFAPRSPAEATFAGVALVSQETALCMHLTVAENVALGVEPARWGWLDRRARAARVLRALEEVTGDGDPIDPSRRASDLAVGERQKVEIARALLRRPDGRGGVLILDEPTSSLGHDDATRLFALLKRLREGGVTILYISHFLEEVARIADRFTVLRDGRTVEAGGTSRIADITTAELVEKMAGRRVEQLFVRSRRTPGEPVLALEGLASAPRLRGAALTLHRGEVLGIAGLVGAGRTELLRAIYGLDAVTGGRLRLLSMEGPAAPRARIRQGVGMVSEDRKDEGLALGLTVADNLTLSRLEGLGQGPFLSRARQAEAARRWIERLAVKTQGPAESISALSGGNQQKVALGRLLHQEADVFLLDEPTRGVDVGSKAAIFRLVDALATAGKAVLFVSSQLPELLGVCDRIAVMRRGVLGVARPAADWTEEALLAEATGA